MIRKLISFSALIISFWIGKLVCYYQLKKEIFYLEERVEKNAMLIKVFYLLIKSKQHGKNIGLFLKDKGYHKIAIYGMHFLGECLYKELREENLIVSYGIDKNANNITADIKIVMPESKLEKVDAIIVTPVCSFNEIKRQLSYKMICPILSIKDILENI